MNSGDVAIEKIPGGRQKEPGSKPFRKTGNVLSARPARLHSKKSDDVAVEAVLEYNFHYI